MVPDFEIEPGVANGSPTLATCGSFEKAVVNAFTCCSTSGVRIDGVPCMTTCTLSPDCDLKLAANKSDAFVDSVFGALKLVVKLLPNAPAITLTPMSAPTHASTTRRRRR